MARPATPAAVPAPDPGPEVDVLVARARTRRDRLASAVAGAAAGPAGVDGGDRALLLDLAQAAGSGRDLRRVLQAVTDAGTTLSGAEFGAFFYNAVDDSGTAYRLTTLSGAEAEHFRTMDSPRITALFEPTFTGRATVRLDDVAADARATGFPPGHLPVRSYLGVPVVARTGEVFGALLFGHRAPGRFDAGVERDLRSVASLAAVAVENARLFEAEQAARGNAERVAAQLSVLHRLTAGLSSAITEVDVLDVLLRDVVLPLGAASVRLYAGDTASWRLVGWRTAPGSPPMPPPEHELPPPIARAMRSGQVVARPTSVSAADMPQLVRAGDCTVRATLCLPLTGHAGTTGGLGVLWHVEREFSAAELTMLAAVAGQIGVTLDRVRLYEAERHAREQLTASVASVTAAAQTLQRSLLPRRLPEVPEVDIAVRYLPGARDVEVGGDWYDVVATDRGPILVIGDVQGHNLAAAAVMGQLRTGLHAYLAEGHELDVAVARANTLLGELDPDVLATCCVAGLDVTQGVLRVVRAGHPRPLVLRAGGRVEQLDVDPEAPVGIPLGVLARATWPVTTVSLDVGDRLVLYTDGLVERRDDDLDVGVDRLVRALAGTAAGDPGAAADVLLDEVGRELSDDVALLVCDVVAVRHARTSASLPLHPGPDAVGEARAFTREVLARWACDVADDATLLVSEMVTNAFRHTDGRAVLELRREPGRVRIGVTDSETRPPTPQQRFDPQATSGRGMQLVDALALAWGVAPTGSGKTVWADLAADG